MKYIGCIDDNNSFFRTLYIDEEYMDFWVCDKFKVNHHLVGNCMKFTVIFKTPTGEVVIDKWGMKDLYVLAMMQNGGTILWRELTSLGVRCSAEPEATIAIINALQVPQLIAGSYKYE